MIAKSPSPEIERPRLGELLVERGKLEAGHLERALAAQAQSRERIGTLLVQLGLVAEREVARALAGQLGIELAEPADYPDAPVLPEEVTREFLQQSHVVPLGLEGERLQVAIADPLDHYALDALRLATGREVDARVGVVSDIEAALQRQYGAGAAEASLETGAGGAGLDDEQRLRDLASEAPVIRLVNGLIGRALSAGASDIHVEPFEHALKVRYRVDGVLREVDPPPARLAAAVGSRIKVLAGLNIAERRLPQDGRIKLRLEGREVDLRVSTIPTLHGESLVLRILDRESVRLDFARLGFGPDLLPGFMQVLDRPHGIVLVTGPTGSGKTTTLYAALEHLNTEERKVLTVEDPVEYHLEGVNQIQVKPQIEMTFANALRSILRQDPDVIMIGEMRDVETARIAVQAALTGHKVFSTLHTNDAASTVTRLRDMGVEEYLLTSTVDAVLAQRLVRTLCTACRESYQADPGVAARVGLAAGAAPTLFRPRGCSACDGRGYRGRAAILELLVMGDAVRAAVLEGGDGSAVQAAAVREGMRTMYQDGLAKALAGVTSLEEILRVTRDA